MLDDPDYDLVQYRYEWTVGGESVRSVTSAALSDALPHHTGFDDDVVDCAVTPSDGVDVGLAAFDTVTLPEPSSSSSLGASLAALAFIYGYRARSRTKISFVSPQANLGI